MKIQTEAAGLVDVLSVAGHSTRVVVPKYRSVFDIGTIDRAADAQQNCFVSHTHMDHSSGLWHHATMQMFMASRKGIYIAPTVEAAEDIAHMLQRCADLDSNAIIAEVRQAKDGHHIIPELQVIAAPSYHRIPSTAYVAMRIKKKLKAEFVGMSGLALADLREKKIDINDVVEYPEFAYTGDTRIEVLGDDKLRKARVLVMECTYVGNDVSISQARQHGHIHLNEIAGNAALLECQHLILMHFSLRHSADEIRAEAARVLPADLLARTTLVVDQHEEAK